MNTIAKCVMCGWSGPWADTHEAAADCPACPKCGSESNKTGGPALIDSLIQSVSPKPITPEQPIVTNEFSLTFKLNSGEMLLLRTNGEFVERDSEGKTESVCNAQDVYEFIREMGFEIVNSGNEIQKLKNDIAQRDQAIVMLQSRLDSFIPTPGPERTAMEMRYLNKEIEQRDQQIEILKGQITILQNRALDREKVVDYQKERIDRMEHKINSLKNAFFDKL